MPIYLFFNNGINQYVFLTSDFTNNEVTLWRDLIEFSDYIIYPCQVYEGYMACFKLWKDHLNFMKGKRKTFHMQVIGCLLYLQWRWWLIHHQRRGFLFHIQLRGCLIHLLGRGSMVHQRWRGSPRHHQGKYILLYVWGRVCLCQKLVRGSMYWLLYLTGPYFLCEHRWIGCMVHTWGIVLLLFLLSNLMQQNLFTTFYHTHPSKFLYL